MHKAIYLEALLELGGDGLAASSGSGVDYGALLQDALRAASPSWTEQSHLSVEVKRIRPAKSPREASAGAVQRSVHFSMLLYLEGEQDAPQNFFKLTTEQMQSLLEKMADQLRAQHIAMKVERIEENTSAVDELADEDAANH